MRQLLAFIFLAGLVGCATLPAASSHTPNDATLGQPPANPSTVNPNLVLGMPRDGNPSDELILDREAYVLSYNPKRRLANWVCWRLLKDDLGKAERSQRFYPDRGLPHGLSPVQPDDYAHSGYDRGHMCPSAHRSSSEAVNKLTFLMTNMQPQLHSLNGGPWKDVETYERQLVSVSSKELHIVAGGVFENSAERRLPSGIAIPKASYRISVVLERGQTARDVRPDTPVVALIMPNDASIQRGNWQGYRVAVDDIEAATGYDFLTDIPDDVEASLEARRTSL